MKPLAQKFITCKVGNGNAIETFSSIGPQAKLSKIFRDGAWCWPRFYDLDATNTILLIQNSITLPHIDTYMWSCKKSVSATDIWEDIRQ